MKAVFFITTENYPGVKNMVYADDVISRQTINFRESRAMGFNKDGYYLEIDGSHEAVKRLKELLGDKAKEVEGKEKENVLKKIKEEEDAAAEGFGNLFG
jgi:hypothetical protein